MNETGGLVFVRVEREPNINDCSSDDFKQYTEIFVYFNKQVICCITICMKYASMYDIGTILSYVQYALC